MSQAQEAHPLQHQRRAAPSISLAGFESPAPNKAPRSNSSRAPSRLAPQLAPLPDEFNEGQSTLILQEASEAPTQLRRARLVVIAGEQQGEVFSLNRALTTMGRSLDNDIILVDIAASRKHLAFERHEEGFKFRDLNSANGVALNGYRALDDELYDDDVLEVGETQMRFESLGERRERPFEEELDTDPGGAPLPPYAAHNNAPTRAAPHPPSPAQSYPEHQAVPLHQRWQLQTPAFELQSPLPAQAPPQEPTRQRDQGRMSPTKVQTPHQAADTSAQDLTRAQRQGQVSDVALETSSRTRTEPPPPKLTASMLPFKSPRWVNADDELTMEPSIEPLPDVPSEPLTPPPKPPPRYHTMGLSGLTPEDLQLPPSTSPLKLKLQAISERLLSLWDAFLFKTGLDRFSPLALLMIALALLASLMLGRYVGRLDRFDPVSFEREVSEALARGALERVELMLDEQRAQLSPSRLEQLTKRLDAQRALMLNRQLTQQALSQNNAPLALSHALLLPTDDPLFVKLAPQLEAMKYQLIALHQQNAKQALWRGELKGTQEHLSRAQEQLNEPRLLTKGAPLTLQQRRLSYALALHREALKSASDALSPSPSEQRALERAAQLTLQGQLKEALQTLKEASPRSGARRQLFELRSKALMRSKKEERVYKRAKKAKRYDLWLPFEERAYLLAGDQDLTEIAALYLTAIKSAVQKARYQEAARHLPFIELLTPQDPSVKSLKHQLQVNAQKWRLLSKTAAQSGERKEAIALLKAALLFLPPDELKEAQAELSSLQP